MILRKIFEENNLSWDAVQSAGVGQHSISCLVAVRDTATFISGPRGSSDN